MKKKTTDTEVVNPIEQLHDRQMFARQLVAEADASLDLFLVRLEASSREAQETKDELERIIILLREKVVVLDDLLASNAAKIKKLEEIFDDE